MTNHGFDYRHETAVPVLLSLAAAFIVGAMWFVAMGAIIIKFGGF